MKLTATQYSAIAIAAAFIAIGSSLGVVFLGHSSGNDPADILPAKETIALVRNADQAAIATLGTHLNGFDAIPLQEHPVDVAVLRLPDGKTAWVVLDSVSAPAGMRYSITASDTAAQGLIGKGADRLSDDGTYADLRAFMADAPFAYVRFPDISMKPVASAVGLFAPSEPVAVTWKDGTMSIVLPGKDILSTLASSLSPSAQTLAESRIRTIVADIFGPSVSPAYDILPLIRSSASVELREGGGIIVVGETDNAADARATIERLHVAFAAGRPGIEVVSRPLDEQFSYTGIRKTDTGVQKTTERRDGFDIVRSHADTAMFLSATRGSNVVLSNTMDGLSAGMTIASDGSPFRSGAHFSFAADAASVRKLFPTLGDAAKSVQWVLTPQNGRLVLEIPR